MHSITFHTKDVIDLIEGCIDADQEFELLEFLRDLCIRALDVMEEHSVPDACSTVIRYYSEIQKRLLLNLGNIKEDNAQ